MHFDKTNIINIYLYQYIVYTTGRTREQHYSNTTGRTREQHYSNTTGRTREQHYSNTTGRTREQHYSNTSGRTREQHYSNTTGRTREQHYSNTSAFWSCYKANMFTSNLALHYLILYCFLFFILFYVFFFSILVLKILFTFSFMLGTFPRVFSQMATSQRCFPNWKLAKCTIFQTETTQVCLSRSTRPHPSMF